MTRLERLQKVIANAGITSRRKAEQMIVNGEVSVNGIIINELGFKVEPEVDNIYIKGKKINLHEEKLVVLFNKPEKVITTMEDPEGRKKVIDFIDVGTRVYPVGRLDYETEGLILLTNDGELANRLMHPSYELDKTYEVIVKGTPSENELDILREGITLEDGDTTPAEIKITSYNKKDKTKFTVTIHEGKNRQIRRMFKYINYQVVHLKRVKYSFLTLKGVGLGEYRILSNDEVSKLKNIVHLN